MCRNIYKCICNLDRRRGSPLRVQEHCDELAVEMTMMGITPACAGTFAPFCCPLFFKWDHPCVCRNILHLDKGLHSLLGSPLRVQEHLANKKRDITGSRITPACAGTFVSSFFFVFSIEDHPCVCRNIVSFVVFFREDWGSPLRVQEHLYLIFQCYL